MSVASTPNVDRFKRRSPYTQIGASGLDVGLPDSQMGNSEVGHTNISTAAWCIRCCSEDGRKRYQDGVLFRNPALCKAMEDCKAKGTAPRLIGLVSPGGVHSHQEHLYGLLQMAKRYGLEKVYVHALLDGRDVPPGLWRGLREGAGG